MPTPELMTWVPAQKRWTKRYRGRRYYVSARQLGTAETKEASVQAANQWWRDKQADLDIAYRAGLPDLREPLPAEDIVSAMIGSGAWDNLKGIVNAAVSHLGQMRPGPEAETLAELMQDAAQHEDETGGREVWERIAADLRERLLSSFLSKVVIGSEPLPAELQERLPPARVHQIKSAVKGLHGECAAAPDRTVKALADNWFQGQKSLVSIKGLSPDRADAARRCLAPFVAFVGETADVSTIDAAMLTAFHRFCLSKIAERAEDPQAGWGVVYAREIFAAARSWIRWLVEQGSITAPPNLASKSFRFGSTVKRIQVWTPEEVRYVIGEAPGKLKLALLLMLNCGMTQGDVSDLLDSEVNWREGRIIRKRSKTAARDSVPVVNYKLWPETFHLMKQYRSGSDRVLLTDAGNPFVRKKMQDGKLVKVDGFARKYDKLRRRIKLKPMKQLRKTAASLLESHETYGRFTSLFLGHAPASMKDRHYAAPPQSLFDAAVAWLGEQLGIAQIAL